MNVSPTRNAHFCSFGFILVGYRYIVVFQLQAMRYCRKLTNAPSENMILDLFGCLLLGIDFAKMSVSPTRNAHFASNPASLPNPKICVSPARRAHFWCFLNLLWRPFWGQNLAPEPFGRSPNAKTHNFDCFLWFFFPICCCFALVEYFMLRYPW